jgi:hypothetical protein
VVALMRGDGDALRQNALHAADDTH